ncbi:hypothetical protein AB7M49_004196 [Bradyrhizobium elkanii]
MWPKMLKVVLEKIACPARPYLSTRLAVGRFFRERMLSETAPHVARIQSGRATAMKLWASSFS